MSKLEQLRTRDATHALTTRVDGRYLATLILFWRKQQCLPKSLSELVRLSLESFTEFLVTNQQIDFVEDFDSAQTIMEGVGLAPKKVNPKYLAKVLSENNPSFAFLTAPDPTHNLKSGVSGVNSINVNAVLAQMQQTENNSEVDRVAEAQKRAEEFTQSLGVIPTEPSLTEENLQTFPECPEKFNNGEKK